VLEILQKIPEQSQSEHRFLDAVTIQLGWGARSSPARKAGISHIVPSTAAFGLPDKALAAAGVPPKASES